MLAAATFRRFGRPLLLLAFGAAAVLAVTRLAGPGGSAGDAGPSGSDYLAIASVPPGPPPPLPGPDASTGTAVSPCGRDEEGHHNGDNLITMPGQPGGAHHSHDYVGNLATDAMSTDRALAAAPTTCRNGDRSSYYWPVLRLDGAGDGGTGGDGAGGDGAGGGGTGGAGDHGPALVPASVLVRYQGNPVGPVVPMPRFLRMITGDPEALSSDPHPQTRTAWSCAGHTDRLTDHYPLCPPGGRLLRIFDFPSCWDGRHTDSPNHRAHVVFPAPNGACAGGTFAVPVLHIEVAYDVPPAARYAVDSFPEQKHSPRTDHAGFVNVMTDAQMAAVVACINAGRHC